jgi:hypothetical protein
MAINDPAVKTSPDLAAPSFAIVSKDITVEPAGEDGRRRFHLTASSTIEDMAGDEIELAALQKAAGQFREGKTIFMDHNFKSVEAAFGLTDRAEVVQKGIDPKSGKPLYDLDVYGVVNTPNPKAAQLADSIDGGYVRFGASLTAFIRKHQRKPNGGMLIKDIDVVEASVVGVAENQRSWAHKAALAVKSFHKPDWMVEEETLMSKDANIEDAPSPDEEVPSSDPHEPVVAPPAEVEHEITTGTTPDEKDNKETTDEVVEKAASTDEADTCPDCGKTRDGQGCDNGFHSVEKSIDESALGVQASAVEDAVETPETAPDVADNAEALSLVEKAMSGVTDDEVKELLGHVTRMVKRIAVLDAENADLKQANLELAESKSTLADEVEDATKVIRKVLDMPLRSQTAGYVEQLAARSDVFAPEVQDFLNKRSKLNG